MDNIILELSVNKKFYNAYNESAIIMSKIFGYKLFHHNYKNYIAIGFPVEKLSHVKTVLKNHGYNYVIVDGILRNDNFSKNRKIKINDIVKLKSKKDLHIEEYKIILEQKTYNVLNEMILTKSEPEIGVILHTTELAKELLGKTIGETIKMKDFDEFDDIIINEYVIIDVISI